MNIHEVIRAKRKELGLTQEQVANYLGVSTPAVNKWEKGATYPDITLLPAIARLLTVDLNTLLSFEETLTDLEIQHFTEALFKSVEADGFEAGFHQAMKKINEYPTCEPLIHSVAMILDSSMVLFGVDYKEAYQLAIEGLYERLLDSNNDDYRLQAISMLIARYMQREDYEKAETFIKLLPDPIKLDKSTQQSELYMKQKRFSEAKTILEEKILNAAGNLQLALMGMVKISLNQDNFDEAIYYASMYEKTTSIYSINDYMCHLAHFEIALTKQNAQQATVLLEQIVTSFQTQNNGFQSPLYQHQQTPTETTRFTKAIATRLLAELKTDARYDFMRTHPQFETILQTFEKGV